MTEKPRGKDQDFPAATLRRPKQGNRLELSTMRQRERDPIKQLKIAAVGLALVAVLIVLQKTGVITAVFGKLIERVRVSVQQDVNKLPRPIADKPQTVVLKTGERIEARKVYDRGKAWSIVRADGVIRTVQKTEVSEIVPNTTQ